MKKPKEIAERIVFLADNGEGLHPISEGAKLIESYAKEHAIEFTEHVMKEAGYPKDLQPYVGLPGMYKKWINQQTQP